MTFNPSIKIINNIKYIKDVIRNKYVKLTPEEIVRQKFIYYLTENIKISKNLISVEKEITVNKLKKRYDIVVYDKNFKPYILVECKSNNVKISQETFNQIATYNIALKVPYLAVTNGINSYFCKIDFSKNSYFFIEKLPEIK